MDAGPGCTRPEPTTPPGGGVPTGSGTTSAAFTQTPELFESCRRAWSFQRPESTAVVPVGKNQLYVPPGTDFPTVRLSVVPVCAVSSLSTTTVGNARSMGAARGRAVAGRDARRHVLYHGIASGSGDESKGGDRVVGQRHPGDPRSVG